MNSQSQISRTVLLLLVTVGLYGIGLVSPAPAQFPSAIEGTVSDPSGAPVPGATVVVINQATNVRYQGVSTSSGPFRVPALPPGTYRVDVQAPGSQMWTQTDVVLEPNKIRTVNPDLKVGTQTTMVSVQATATAVETAKSDNSRTVGTTSISDAPISQRNIYTGLAAIAPASPG